MTTFDLTGETTRRCPHCGALTVESYSERRATIDPDGVGYFYIHPTARRVGDGALLGREECPSGQLGWGAGAEGVAVS